MTDIATDLDTATMDDLVGQIAGRCVACVLITEQLGDRGDAPASEFNVQYFGGFTVCLGLAMRGHMQLLECARRATLRIEDAEGND